MPNGPIVASFTINGVLFVVDGYGGFFCFKQGCWNMITGIPNHMMAP